MRNHFEKFLFFINPLHISSFPYNYPFWNVLIKHLKDLQRCVYFRNYVSNYFEHSCFPGVSIKKLCIAKSCKSLSTSAKKVCLSWRPFEKRNYFGYSNRKVLPSMSKIWSIRALMKALLPYYIMNSFSNVYK